MTTKTFRPLVVKRLLLERTDAELVQSAAQGDRASFASLYERHYRMAVGIARSRLSDEHLAEDAAQEAFADACRTLSTLQNGQRFPQWLGTICRRTASRIANQKQARTLLHEDEQPASDRLLSALHQQVHEALGQLDDMSREIILLHYFSRMTYEEIASALDLSTQAIHGRLQRARRKLAEILQPTGAKE